MPYSVALVSVVQHESANVYITPLPFESPDPQPSFHSSRPSQSTEQAELLVLYSSFSLFILECKLFFFLSTYYAVCCGNPKIMTLSLGPETETGVYDTQQSFRMTSDRLERRVKLSGMLKKEGLNAWFGKMIPITKFWN